MYKKIAVIGHGAMGEAFVAGMLKRNVVPADHIVVSGPRLDRRKEFASKFDVRVTASNVEAVAGVDVVILAVKPQQLAGVIAELRGKLGAQTLVVSIVAGKTIGEIASGLDHRRIVRTMPNLPAQIGEGITAWFPAPEATHFDLNETRIILSALGKEILLDAEKQLDMVTAVSGTGPAYVFEFMQTMVRAAITIGLPRRIARELVLVTVRGSAQYAAQQNGHHLAELFERVMSPGGTTAAAHGELVHLGFSHSLIAAIVAAHSRAKELGGK